MSSKEVVEMSTPFTVMTWNVENLFPPGSFVGPNSPNPVTQADFEEKIDTLANFILGLADQPDVIALQEIGGQNDADMRSPDTLAQALGGAYDNRAVSQHPDRRHIRVAFLSRLPLTNPVDITDFPDGPMGTVQDFNTVRTAMGRGALKVEVEPLPGVRVRLITAHLKSKLLTFPRAGGGTSFSTQDENIRAFAAGIALSRRVAEAITVRAFLSAEMEADPTIQTIVLGDMNDGPLASASQVFLGPPDADIRSDDQFDSVRLYNLVDAVPVRGPVWHAFLAEDQEPHFTRIHDGRGEIIDHIMASKGLIVQDDEFAVDVRIFKELIVDQDAGANPNARVGNAIPDHAPIIARFELTD
jgi:endonuclease/exonuclease/phosphatase family metal-dependent hydrolase